MEIALVDILAGIGVLVCAAPLALILVLPLGGPDMVDSAAELTRWLWRRVGR